MINEHDLSSRSKEIEPDCEGSPAKGIMSGAAIMTPVYVILVSVILWLITRHRDRGY